MTQHELEIRALVEDVAVSAAAIEEYVHGLSFEQYESDRRTRVAVEREFIIIGEALGAALRLEPGLTEQITKARVIADFRNVLVHGYRQLHHPTVWRVVHEHLPQLIEEVQAFLKS